MPLTPIYQLVLRRVSHLKVIEYRQESSYEKLRTRKEVPPGIIVPSSLESIITNKLDIIVFEFFGKVVIGTNFIIHNYTYLYIC
ncbi:MAG: DUF1297 domain-containing protein [Pyrodictiaceae archaeon]